MLNIEAVEKKFQTAETAIRLSGPLIQSLGGIYFHKVLILSFTSLLANKGCAIRIMNVMTIVN